MITAMALSLIPLTLGADPGDIRQRVTSGFVENGDVRLHYASLGEGPLIVFIHGFPDFWYTWRHQMTALSETHRCVAVDLRGYHKSGKPEGQERYDIEELVGDIKAVIAHFGEERAIVAGHDWGGFIAWSLAAQHPERVSKLVVCNLPHPHGLMRELRDNPEQQRMSGYARGFQVPGAHRLLSAEMLADIVAKGDAETKAIYEEAFAQSDFAAMLAYYLQNFPHAPYDEMPPVELPQIQAPVLLFHGLDDTALHASGLNETWRWVNAPLTIVTIPGADHWVHIDAADYVSETMRDWLLRH